MCFFCCRLLADPGMSTEEIFVKNPSSQKGTPLLQTGENESFPTDAELNVLYTKVCGGKHNGHPYDREACYMHYLRSCKSNEYLPASLGTEMAIPISPSILTDRASLTDHLAAILDAQPATQAGGSFRPFLKDSVNLVKSNRQVALDSDNIEVKSIVYGISPVQEVKEFIRSFNLEISRLQAPGIGSFPLNFYFFDVMFCRTKPGVLPRLVSHAGARNGIVLGQPGVDLPARICFGFWNKRWDIIFNYEYTRMDPNTYEADFQLVMPTHKLQDIWFKIFSNLHGFAISVDLNDKVGTLFNFISSTFQFRNCIGTPVLKTMDISVLLAIVGWNYPTINSVALMFIFTGGLLFRPWQLRYGFGRWCDDRLPRSLDLYLQSECFALLNATLVSLMTWMVHWFVTPGISALVSKKDPEKFLRWMATFQVEVLKGAILPTPALFHELSCRSSDPSALLSKISYLPGSNPVFRPGLVAMLIPPWDNITGNNCPTDILAFSHLFQHLHPEINANSTPKHLRLESDPGIVFTALTGRDLFAGNVGTKLENLPGCTADTNLLSLIELMDEIVENGHNTTVGRVYRVYRDLNMKVDDLAKKLTPLQLSILYAWIYPEKFTRLYEKSFEIDAKTKYFLPTDLIVLKPLVSAYLGCIINDPHCLKIFKMNRFSAKDVCRFAAAECLLDSENPTVRQTAEKRMKLAAKKQRVTLARMRQMAEDMFPTRQAVLQLPGPVPAVEPAVHNPPAVLAVEPAVPAVDYAVLSSPDFSDMDEPYSPSSPTRDMEVDELLAQSSDIELQVNPDEMDAFLQLSP